ncbi:putative reverse transcriptase domain-containing protein, partial [Tanacetum coccineum]
MPLRMTTRSAGRQTAAPRGGRTGGRTGRGGGRTREPTGRVSGRTGNQDGQGGDQGIRADGGVDEVPDFSMIIAQQLQDLLPIIITQVGNHASNIQGDVKSANVSNCRNSCSYKEFIACNPKDYDGKGDAIVYTRWIEKMESVQTKGQVAVVGMTWEEFKVLVRKEFCPNNEMQMLETEFWCHAMVRASHATYTDRFHELARLVPHLVTPENKRIERYIYDLAPHIRAMVAATELITIQSVVLKAGMLTDEAIRNGSLKKNTEKRGNGGELSRNENVRDDKKRSKTGRPFSVVTKPVRKEYTGTTPKDCKVGPRMVTPVNARNLTTARGVCFECSGRGNNGNQACGGAFMIGAEEARQDPNIVTGTFTLNNHYATTLFDSGADYSFVSTTFIPLLDIEPSDLGFSYEIEIASGQLVEINKVIRNCKLEIEGHTFDIDVILFGHGSFDVIVGMDWFSRHKAEIICHEKVVRIPLPHGEILRVLGEKPKEKLDLYPSGCEVLVVINFRLCDVVQPILTQDYLRTSLDDTLHKVIQRHTAELIKEHSVPADVVKVPQQQQKPQKSAADICKIKMEQAGKLQETKYTITSSAMTHKALYHALIESILEDEDAMDKGVADRLKKRKPDDADKDEGPPAGPDQRLKRKKTGKDTKPSKMAKSTRTSKGTT